MAETTRTTTNSPISGTPGQSVPGQPQQQQQQRGSEGTLSEVREMGNELVGAVRDSANSLFEEQRNRAADQIAALGTALRQSAKSLDQDGGTIAQYADDAARQIGNFAETLRNRSWEELAGDVEDFARQWPIAFLAAAVGVGFIAGRFLISSAARSADAGANRQGSLTQSNMGGRPPGWARQDSGSVSGAVSGSAKSGYGATAARENG